MQSDVGMKHYREVYPDTSETKYQEALFELYGWKRHGTLQEIPSGRAIHTGIAYNTFQCILRQFGVALLFTALHPLLPRGLLHALAPFGRSLRG
jgi:hypothetical protein